MMELARTRLKNSVSAHATNENIGGNGIEATVRLLADGKDSSQVGALQSGLITAIWATNGRKVKRSDPLVQIRADVLKRDVMIKAPHNGTVKSIRFRHGDAVIQSDLICKVVKEEDTKTNTDLQGRDIAKGKLETLSPTAQAINSSIRRVEECRGKDDIKPVVSTNLAAEKEQKDREEVAGR